ncbi:MAG TPA: phosphatase PAP2 family protein [Terriglobia bacterium]|nr:phosphatase PAP2 family protein [Terriglobia bacterium]
MHSVSLRPHEWINVAFFLLLSVLAWVRPSARRRWRRATLIGSAGIGLTLAAAYFQQAFPSVLRDWLPAPLMLFVYWQAGGFVDRPNEALQARLEEFDSRVMRVWRHFRGISLLETYLEFAYLLCYPLIPLSLGALYLKHLANYTDRYWLIVLPATYLCYILVPFIQVLPPRLLGREQESRGKYNLIRSFNLWILQHASIQVVTFPSAHVASTTAASLVLLQLMPSMGLIFLLLSISIMVGAVVGRYHYALDAILGLMLAIVVFVVVAWMSG